MAIVTIVRGNTRLRVPESIFKTYYQNIGYRKEGAKKRKPMIDIMPDDETESRHGDETDVDSIPVSEMTQTQLKEYAERHNIDISSAKKPSDARRIIQKHIQEAKM